jgi:hypothetical protein
MTLEDEEHSSILLHAGTNLGRVVTFKLLPEQSGRYYVQYVGSTSLSDWIIQIQPIRADTGKPAYATQNAVSGLRDGVKVNGVILAVSHSEARLFKPASSKGAHKSWDEFLCDSAAVVRYQEIGWALLGLFGDGRARLYSLPGLRELGAIRVDEVLDVKMFDKACITVTGDIMGWTGPSEVALINIFGSGLNLNRSKDTLFNPECVIPARPTISNMQWISGTQFVTPADMDLLIGGPDRPPSKRMLEQARAEGMQRRADARSANQPESSSGAPKENEEGYWAYMQRQINERTEKLGTVNDNMDRLGESSSKWSDDVSKFVQKQKRGLVMGAVKSRFGL